MVTALIHLVIWLIVVGVIFWLLIYLLDTLPVPEPFKTVGRTVILVVGVLICILILLQFAGMIDVPRLKM